MSKADAGKDIAEIIENSEFVLKVAGYDNVGVTRVSLTGVKKMGTNYLLTGNNADVLSGDDFPLQQIPGTLRAYSALRLITAPAYSNSALVDYDSYPVTVTAFDERGNSSKVEVVVGVKKDLKPEVVDIISNQESYFALDSVRLNILAKDDRAVNQLVIKYYLGDKLLQTTKLGSAEVRPHVYCASRGCHRACSPKSAKCRSRSASCCHRV